MRIESAIHIVKTYYDGILNATLIEAIGTLVEHASELSDEQTQEVYDALWVIAWDRRFLVNTLHDRNNPGLVADINKGRFRRTSTSNAVGGAAVAEFMRGRS
jgi:hypothetical protein